MIWDDFPHYCTVSNTMLGALSQCCAQKWDFPAQNHWNQKLGQIWIPSVFSNFYRLAVDDVIIIWCIHRFVGLPPTLRILCASFVSRVTHNAFYENLYKRKSLGARARRKVAISWLCPDGFDCQENCIERVLAQPWIVVHRSTPGINHRRPTSWIARENLVPSKSWDCQGSRYKAKLCHDFDHLLLPRAEFRVYFDGFSWSGSTLSLCTQTIGTAILQYQNFNICKIWGQIISLIKEN